MKCKNIMRRPVQTLGTGATVEAAASRMNAANIGLIPIVGPRGNAIGVLTDRDIAIRVVAAGLPSTTLCVEVMTRDVVTCGPEDDLESIARKMAKYRKSRVLVSEGERLIGIVSLSDLASTDISIAALALHDVASREVIDEHGNGSARPHGA